MQIEDQIQCVVTTDNISINNQIVSFGESQKPGWMDYADGVDTMKFLITL